MIEVKQRQILVDGEPQIVMAGEVHYFRVAREGWDQRLDLVVEAGCNAVAAYLPWIFHELPDGSLDVQGRTRPERDVGAFIDLCRSRGLWFIARPGPFVMAELKNEGIPYRVRAQHPETLPVGWDGVPATTDAIDYLAPAYLAEVERWYDAIMPILRPRLQPSGGNVITVQLDNEIGMLAWVSNTPDLTPDLLADFGGWVLAHGADPAAYPVRPGDEGWAHAVRSPAEAYAGRLRVDLGLFMRSRFARYVRTLRAMCESRGVTGVPFAVNIHGTDGGHGGPFPIGISQLVQTYAGVPGMISGSDHYLGDATVEKLTDLYVMNAYMAAVHDADQPLTSLEFEAGSGDYGGGGETQYDPSSVDLKTRICLAQGNRLVNYYLFAGGINPLLDERVGDGNERLSFTGERHGTAAPVGPRGEKGFAYDATAATLHAVRANAAWLSRMDEQHDAVQLGLVLDAYATEYHHPGSMAMSDAVGDLSAHRGAGQRLALARGLLLNDYRFGAVHLEARAPDPRSVVAVGVGRYLSAVVQQRLVDHADAGGGVLLLGPAPVLDLDGSPCTTLVDALGVRPGGVVRQTNHYFASLVAGGWAEGMPEVRTSWRQELHPTRGDVVLRDVYGAACGLDVAVGDGRVVWFAAEVPGDRGLFGAAMTRLGARAGLSLDAPWQGMLATTTATQDGQRALHLLNAAGRGMPVEVRLDGVALHDGARLQVPPRSGHILPCDLRVGGHRVLWAGAEVAGVAPGEIRFGPGLGHPGDAAGTLVVFGPGTQVSEDPAYAREVADDGTVRVTSRAAGPLRVLVAPGPG